MAEENEHHHQYQSITSYGVIGDCHTALLISPEGSVDWGCLPDFDSPAIFCRLLDAQHGGYFQIAPTEGTIPGSQCYIPGSNILQTRFASILGGIVLTDFMPVETLSACSQQPDTKHVPRTEEENSFHCLVRSVECTHGTMSVTMKLKVSPDYASSPSQIMLVPDGKGVVVSGPQQHVALGVVGTSLLPSFSFEIDQEEDVWHQTVMTRVTLHEGERLLFILGMGSSRDAALKLVEDVFPQRDFAAELAHTLHCWRQWVAGCDYHGPYAEWVQRSALALKMMTYAPTGAVVAAPTTSLPEELGGERNWDYRFTWLRDAALTFSSLNILGFTDETRAFTYWLHRLSPMDSDDVQIMYGIRGERELPELELSHLSGYCNSSPVRIGNEAVQQKQHDVFGEVLDCLYLSRLWENGESSSEVLNGPLWELIQTLVEYVCAHWQEPDSGIWEVRGDTRHYVYSKVMCWVTLDRAVRIVQHLNLNADLPRWIMVRDQIHLDILTHGYNQTIGAFTQSYGDTALDASSLLLPLVGFLPPDDPRMCSTVDRIMEEMSDEHGFVYRYVSADGLRGSEGTFTPCTFWLVDNLAMQGRVNEAHSLFERLMAYAGNLGLFAEEIDASSGMALGNYPQAFTHCALINSACNLSRAESLLSEHHANPVITALRLNN
jgi:Glucoamylase and related glycosyl hydrolases